MMSNSQNYIYLCLIQFDLLNLQNNKREIISIYKI